MLVQVVWNAERLGVGIHFNTAVWWKDHVSPPRTCQAGPFTDWQATKGCCLQSHHGSRLLPVQACLLVMGSQAKYLLRVYLATPLLPTLLCLPADDQVWRHWDPDAV